VKFAEFLRGIRLGCRARHALSTAGIGGKKFSIGSWSRGCKGTGEGLYFKCGVLSFRVFVSEKENGRKCPKSPHKRALYKAGGRKRDSSRKERAMEKSASLRGLRSE
jgi:hypothetical protein